MRRLGLGVALLLMAGCVQTNPFVRGGYQDRDFPVFVQPSDAGRLVSENWLVDGWQLNAQERPVRRVRTYGTYGAYGHRVGLALRHRTNQGRMWLDVVPVAVTVRDQDLHGVARDVVASSPRENKFDGSIASVVGEAAIAISRHAGHMVLVEAGSGEGLARGALVFVRANYLQQRARRWRVVPVIVVAGYANDAADFEAGLADFQTFLASIQLGPSVSGATEPSDEPSGGASTELTEPSVEAPAP
ncbi:MAG: hypothetical protein KC593_19430 [Myxococcales bacterium]|nr:hypothetical protein [Myxococcales bacterium]MCB9629257.1 hypothetical protein [Sandaracinaceae bacterium]